MLCIINRILFLFRLGFESKNFLSYTNFLSAFEDPRHSNSSLASTESHSSLSSKTNFEIREDMPPEAVVAKLRKCVPQNAEAIRNVSNGIRFQFNFQNLSFLHYRTLFYCS